MRRTRDATFRLELEAFAGLAPKQDEVIEPITGMRFLRVPGGTFSMGSKDGRIDEKPAHPVTVSDFWLAATPVTNAQYRLFVEATEKVPEYWTDPRFNQPKQPVVGVSWYDAMDFCEWLPSPLAHQAPDETRAWYDQSDDAGTKPVGEYSAGIGSYGHLDLAGNVWEWCRDTYVDKAYSQPPHINPARTNPEMTKSNKGRAVERPEPPDPVPGLSRLYLAPF